MPQIPDNVANAILLKQYRIAAITAYNRLEPTPRTVDFERSLRAEIRDPLWMLTRQWQFGEFQGEDAASAVTAQILGEHTTFDRLRYPGGTGVPYSTGAPLEVKIENEQLAKDLALAVQMARYFLRLMRDNGLESYLGMLQTQYPLEYIIDPNDVDGAFLLAAANGYVFDGYLAYQDMITPSGPGSLFDKWMNDASIPTGAQQSFRTIGTTFRTWFGRTFEQPGGATQAWQPSKLEYQFGVNSSLQQQVALAADQYFDGHLDWYSFDLSGAMQTPAGAPSAPATGQEQLVSFIPSPVTFKGMPNPRYWMMEEQKTDFGAIDTGPTGLLHLLLAEFGLVYANDWFLLPYPLDINTLCELKGITVTDVFGQHTLIQPAGRGSEETWQRWAMFHLTDTRSGAPGTNFFYLPPVLPKTLDGDPLEQVNFARDEMANLAWAVEKRVPSQAGMGVSGDEMARPAQTPPPFVPENDQVMIRYVAGTLVPENWIPLIPVPMQGSDREIRLQRARMPASKGPLGRVLSEQPAPYYLDEEEIPRSGIVVQRGFSRARWLNGSTFLWIGRSKSTGKGEAWSNLKFDQIEDIPQNLK